MNIRYLKYILFILSIFSTISSHAHTLTENVLYSNSSRKLLNVYQSNNLKCDIDTIRLKDGRIFTKLFFEEPGCYCSINPGLPQGKYVKVRFEVPFYSRNFSSSCWVGKPDHSILVKYPVLPFPIQNIENRPIKDEDYVIEYEKEDVIKNILNSYVFDDYIEDGDHHFVDVIVPVFNYEHSKKLVNLYSSMLVELTWEDCPVDEMHSISLPKNKKLQVNGINSLVNTNAEETDMGTAKERTVIVASQYYKDYLDDYILWRNQRGHDVFFVSLESILRVAQTYSPKPLDDAEAIRMWLQQTWRPDNKFSLFILDGQTYPVPYRKFDYPEESYMLFNSERYIPSDVYYVDINTKYGLYQTADNHYTCNIYSTQYSPSIPTGRLQFNKNEDLMNYFNKLLIYEGNPGLGNTSYLRKGLLTQQAQHLGYNSLFTVMKCIPDSIILRDNLAGNYNNNLPTGNMVVREMSDCGLISLQGHGDPVTLATSGNSYTKTWRCIKAMENYNPNSYSLGINHELPETNNGIDLMDNKYKPSVAYSLSCTVMPFDHLIYEDTGLEFNHPYNIGTSFTAGGAYGGVAFIGNTRIGWDYATQKMEVRFAEECLLNKSIGEGVNESRKVINSRYSQYTHNILGDPNIKIWLGEPNLHNITVSKNNQNIYLNGIIPKNTELFFWDGSSNSTKHTIDSFTTSTSISAVDIPFLANNPNQDYLIQVCSTGYVPFFYLIAPTGYLMNKTKRYITGNLFMDSSNQFKVASSGILLLNCIGKFISNGGLEIGNNGQVKIESLSETKLQNDEIKLGGKLEIRASKIVLSSGFKASGQAKLIVDK